MTDLTVRTLEDKTSSARRYSIQLLTRLLETHPFGALHGGTLNLSQWQERYDKVSAELEKVDTQEMEKARRDAGIEDSEDEDDSQQDKEQEEDADATEEATGEQETQETPASSPKAKKEKKPRPSQIDIAAVEAEQSSLDPQEIMRLRLTKKYYTDALHFINQIEGAIPTLCQLLASTSKSEVLESMKFFRTAYEYDIESAEKGIKQMLHLIWTKDNNVSTEEGMEGRTVRGNLIDVYRTLYFDVVPDLTPKQQVNRITKNMIE